MRKFVLTSIAAALAAALGGCQALTYPEQITIAAQQIPSPNAPPPAAPAAQAPTPGGGARPTGG